MSKRARSLYPLLLDKEGKVVGFSESLKELLPVEQGVFLQALWPQVPLRDGASFSFTRGKTNWHLNIFQVNSFKKRLFVVLLECFGGRDAAEIGEKLQQLSRQIKFYHNIFENACDELYVADGKGVTIFANRICEKNYGVPLEEIIGKSVWDLEERGIYYPAVTPLVLKEKKTITIDQETAVGKRLMITANPVFDEEGEVEMVVCNSRDITALEEMKQNYLEMRKKAVLGGVGEQQQNQDKLQEEKQIFSSTSPMLGVLSNAHKMAQTDTTVLLLGESGTGKDLLARSMHEQSKRKDKQFLKINCAALPKELLESELFGYKAGAFTGANPKGKIGLFTLADGGTVLLDEIAEIPLQLQPKLLQVIEEQKFTPIGSQEVKKINVRIIAATNRDLKKMIEEGTFREDLYYRLYVLSLKLPPLRERIEDIPPLSNYFLQKFAGVHDRRVELNKDALELLKAYPWPGNVRELKHLVEHLVVIAPAPVIKPEHLPGHISSSSAPAGDTLAEALQRAEREIIIRSFRKWGSSYKVARSLGISQSSASRKIRKYLQKQ